MRRLALLIATVVVAVTLGGCSSGTGPSPNSTSQGKSATTAAESIPSDDTAEPDLLSENKAASDAEKCALYRDDDYDGPDFEGHNYDVVKVYPDDDGSLPLKSNEIQLQAVSYWDDNFPTGENLLTGFTACEEVKDATTHDLKCVPVTPTDIRSAGEGTTYARYDTNLVRQPGKNYPSYLDTDSLGSPDDDAVQWDGEGSHTITYHYQYWIITLDHAPALSGCGNGDEQLDLTGFDPQTQAGKL